MYYRAGVHHLFYLYMSTSASPGDGIGHARSDNGVDWYEDTDAVAKAPDADWLGSGAVWRVDERYIMNFSEMRYGKQTIFFAESSDLVSWARTERALGADPTWYNDTPTGRWDCIYPVLTPGGGFEGYLTATPWTVDDVASGLPYRSIGHVCSPDGVLWRAAAPPSFDWRGIPVSAFERMAEVGGVENHGGNYHLILCCFGNLGDAGGAYSFRSARLDGPFSPAQRNYRLLSSRRYLMSYFPRFYRYQAELLVNHHSITRAGERWFAPLKTAALDPEGDLYLGYWSGNDGLKGQRLPLTLGGKTIVAHSGALPDVQARHDALEVATESWAVVELAQGSATAGTVVEANLSATPPRGGFGGAGLYLELDGDERCIIVMHTHGQTSFFDLHAQKVPELLENPRPADDTIELGLRAGTLHELKLLVRGTLLELYLDGRLVHCYSLSRPWAGGLGLVAEKATARLSSVRAWAMS